MVVGMKLNRVLVCGCCWLRTTQEVVDDVVNFRGQIIYCSYVRYIYFIPYSTIYISRCVLMY